MAGAIWKGDISFGLVSIPVSLVSTEENNEIHFHLLNIKTNRRVRYQRVDEETGKEVPWKDIVKGYEYDKDNYIIINEEAFETASPELFKTINIEEFVDLKEIDNLYYTKPYYLVPEGKNHKAYVLLREALKKTQKIGVAKIILRTKEYLSMVLPHDDSILLYLIHYKDELRVDEKIHVPHEDMKTYKISDKEVKMAVDLIKDMSSPWEPEKYHNEYREALQKWLDNQIRALTQKGKKPTRTVHSEDAVVDFVSLLKESRKKKKLNESGRTEKRMKTKK